MKYDKMKSKSEGLFQMKSGVIFLCIFLGVMGLPAYAGGIVDLPGEARGYLAAPENPEGRRRPAVLFVHEWWGLTDSIRKDAERLAGDGFIVLAVDLYDGRVTSDPVHAYQWKMELREEDIREKLKSGLDFLEQFPAAKSTKLGAVGWGIGGKWVFHYAASDPRVRSIALYYSKVGVDPDAISKMNIPFLLFYGEKDKSITAEWIKNFKFRLNQLQKRFTIHSYPRAGYGFADSGVRTYRSADAEDAWQKLRIFLKANLA